MSNVLILNQAKMTMLKSPLRQQVRYWIGCDAPDVSANIPLARPLVAKSVYEVARCLHCEDVQTTL